MSLIIKVTGFSDYLAKSGGSYIKCLILGEPDSGKGHPVDTPVLTPTGWTEIGKLQIGDELVGSDGRPTAVTGVHDRGVLPLLRVGFNDGANVLVDPEHLWQVADHHGTNVRETQRLGELTRKVGPNEVLKWGIPTVGPVAHPQADLPLDPYVLGALLGNGHFAVDHVQLTVAFGPEWQDQVEAIEARTPPWMALREVTRKANATARQFHLHDCLPILRELGLVGVLSRDKCIPSMYLTASIEQRADLLAGLMDTDGGMSGKTAWFYSTSRRLAGGVIDLVRSLGGWACLDVQHRENKPTEYNVKVRMDRNPFRHGPKPSRWRPASSTARRIASVEPAGYAEVRCISVAAADHLYVTKDYLVTHNTRSASFWPDPIFADTENGRMSIADRQVPYGEVKSSKDMDALLARLKLECQKPEDKRIFRTLVIDTIDSYQRKLIAERLREERKESLSGWADWGFLDAKMTQLLDAALNLPMNVVVNLHVKDESDGDEDSRTLIKKSELKGAIKDQIAGQFDLVGYMEKSYVSENGKRTLKRQIRWHSEPRYPMAKDRSGRLPRFTDVDFTDDDFNRIYTAIVGDHLKDLPESGVFEELDTGEVEPAGPDLKGGPVDVEPIPPPRQAPAKRAAAKKKPAPKAKPEADGGDSSAPPAEDATETTADESQPVTRVENVDGVGEVNTDTGEIASSSETETEEVTEEEGIQNVKDQLDATEEEAPKGGGAASSDDAYPDNPLVCGDQPAGAHRKHPAVPGCKKSLAEENRDQVNIALLRTHTLLCAACLAAWKASQ